MHRSVRVCVLTVVLALVGSGAPVMAARPAASAAEAGAPGVRISVPRSAKIGLLTAIHVTLPHGIAAVDGRVMLAKGSASLMGVAIRGAGTVMRPVTIRGGFAFGVYGMKPQAGSTELDLVLLPMRRGRINARVLIDATARASGARVTLSGDRGLVGVEVRGGDRVWPAPAAAPRLAALRPASAVHELLVDGRIGKPDLDLARAGWELARLKDRVCRTGTDADANDDGCTDIVDLQSTLAARGRVTAQASPHAAPPPGGRTLVVNSTADTPDAAPGNGVCADTQGRCTLRAAITEADVVAGLDRIHFDLPGSAPVVIHVGSRLPYITSRAGSLIIDGYTQAGSRVNDLQYGSNAIPGVEIRGNGPGAKEIALYITSPGNIVRGIAISEFWRGIMLDGPNAHDNRVVGDWIGFHGDGTNASFGNYGVLLNVGAHDNVVGTPDLDDRNVIGNWSGGVNEYGPGVAANVVRNGLFCIRPSGETAICNMGIDHNFGPKDGVIGGDGPNELNIIGPTFNQGIEISHGWDPARIDTSTKYQVNGHRVTGNWVGFRADGSYDPAYRSGRNGTAADNGNGINVYDGSNDNIVQRNYVSSMFDGIQVMAPNAQRNIVRGNVIGESPQGQAAPMTGWGVKIRWGTKNDLIANNTIRHAAQGGVGLVQDTVFNIRISRNVISNTSGPAIDLYGVPGPDPNDPGDADNGANTLLNSPDITSATTDQVSGTAVVGALVEVYQASRADGLYGLPVAFLGDVVATDGTWTLPISGLVDGDRVTALQIRSDDQTSELAANVPIGGVIIPPPPPDPLAEDHFERTVAGGWGDAAFGGGWSQPGSYADFRVDGGMGRITTPKGQTRESRLSIGAADVTISGILTFDARPVGKNANAYAYVVARQSGNGKDAYRGAIRIAPNGNVYVQLKRAVNRVETNIASEVPVSGLTMVPGTPLAFRFRVVGTDLRLRVWDPAGTEPATWQATATDTTAALQGAGGIGLLTYLSGSATNGPILVSLDDLAVPAP